MQDFINVKCARVYCVWLCGCAVQSVLLDRVLSRDVIKETGLRDSTAVVRTTTKRTHCMCD
jgi:hypothetical protein